MMLRRLSSIANMTRRNRSASSIVAKAAELSLAVPQVVAHRVARMALANPATLSKRDRREFQRMGAEKVAAFTEAWNAMATQATRAHQTLATNWMRSLLSPWQPGHSPLHVPAQWQRAALGVIEKGMAPVHRKATANARRLGRTKLR